MTAPLSKRKLFHQYFGTDYREAPCRSVSSFTIGLGFLFLIIFALTIYGLLKIQELAKDADNILKDNYASLVYCKNMLLALDDIGNTVSIKVFSKDKAASYTGKLFESSKSTFDSNLKAEKNNITEVHEGDYVAELDHDYSLLLALSSQIDEKGGSLSVYFNDFIPGLLEYETGNSRDQ